MNLKETIFPDHFSQSNKIGVVLCLIISALAMVAILQTKTVFNKNKKDKIAKIKSLSNNVRLKEYGSSSFYDIQKGEDLQNGDEIYTGMESNATVVFDDLITTINITSSSLVKIEVIKDEESGKENKTIEIKSGSANIVIPKGETVAIKSNGETQQISAREDNSIVKLAYLSGLVQFYTESKGVKIKNKKGTITEVTNKVTLSETKEITKNTIFTLISPTYGQKLDTLEGIKITTNLKSKYTVHIYKDFNIVPPLYETKFENSSFLWADNFKEGDYFFSIENETGSRTVPVKLISAYEVDGFKPADGETLEVNTGEKSTLSWKPLNVSSYLVSIIDFQGKERSYKTNTNQLQIEGLSGSSIKWFVKPQLLNGSYSKPSKAIETRLKYNGKISFTGMKAKEKYKIADKEINLKWLSPRGEAFEIKIVDLKTNLEIASSKIKKNKTSILLTKEGAFKAVVSSIDFPDFEKAEFLYDVSSPVLKWDLNLPKEFTSTEDDEVVKLKFISKPNISKIAKLHQKYIPLKGKPLLSVLNIESSEKVQLKGFGQYCYLAHLLAPVEYFHDSDIYCFNLVQLPAFDQIPKAKNTILENNNSNGIETYKFFLPTVKNAVKYHAELFREISGKTLIYSTDSTTPQISWKTKRSGIYYMKYKVYDKKNRESEFSPFSKIIFPISPLSTWEEDK